MNIALAAGGGTLYEIYGIPGGIFMFLFWLLPPLLIICPIYLGYLIFRKGDRKKGFVVAYLLLIALSLIEIVLFCALMLGPNPIWIENLLFYLLFAIGALFFVLSYFAYKNSKSANKKWFKYCMILLIFILALAALITTQIMSSSNLIFSFFYGSIAITLFIFRKRIIKEMTRKGADNVIRGMWLFHGSGRERFAKFQIYLAIALLLLSAVFIPFAE